MIIFAKDEVSPIFYNKYSKGAILAQEWYMNKDTLIVCKLIYKKVIYYFCDCPSYYV